MALFTFAVYLIRKIFTWWWIRSIIQEDGIMLEISKFLKLVVTMPNSESSLKNGGHNIQVIFADYY
jgi:hypothetical protein